MNLTNEIKDIIYIYCDTKCQTQWCQSNLHRIRAFLFEALRSDEVIDFKEEGLYRFKDGRRQITRYSIQRTDGKKMLIAFTGMGTIRIFSKRGRDTCCYFKEFKSRLLKFLVNGYSFVHQPY